MIRKSVIITGASGGIGSETALKFARNGYNVGITYNKNKSTGLEEKIKKLGVDCLMLHLDQTDIKEIGDVFDKFFSHFDYVECVVCNAGVAEKGKLLIDRKDEDIQKILDVNLMGTICANREACKHLIQQKKGSIVNVSSILGKVGGSCEVVYSASKAGIIGLTKALAKEVGEFGIRVNAVAPGMIQTNMTAGFSKKEKDNLVKMTALNRLGEVDDVASVIYFLGSDESKFVTGECIEVSGGLLI